MGRREFAPRESVVSWATRKPVNGKKEYESPDDEAQMGCLADLKHRKYPFTDE
jgi:hypothetical protein